MTRCKTRICRWVLLALSPCVGPVGAVDAQMRPLDGLDAYIQRSVQDWGIAGLSIAVIKDDSVVFVRGYGVREVGGGEPVDANTLFAIGSNTKLFTAVTAGMLVDEGTMSWDDPATTHLPGFQLFDPYATREITVRDLLAHRSGLGRRGDLLWYASGHDRSEVLRRIRDLEPNSSFRSAYGYQNVMFLAAGEAVARVAGSSWDDLIRDRILRPLGMARSGTSTRELERAGNVAAPHLAADGALTAVPYRNIDNVAPAGSINSSALEMAQWLRMLLGEGAYRGRRIIEPATLQEILTPQTIIPVRSDTLFPSTHFVTYGMGAVLQDYRGAKVAWHTGGIDGMLSLVGMIPEEELGVVILTNTAGRNNLYTALMYRVFDAYLGAPPRDWSAILLRRMREQEEAAAKARRALEESRVSGTRPSLAAEAYTGRYRSELYGEVVVARAGEGLALRFGPELSAELEHWHYDTFRTRGAGGLLNQIPFVRFELDARGEIRSVEIQGVDEFRRVAEPQAVQTGR